MYKNVLMLDKFLMKYEGELPPKSSDLLGLNLSSIAVKGLQKKELNISVFKVFDRFVIHGCLKNYI